MGINMDEIYLSDARSANDHGGNTAQTGKMINELSTGNYACNELY